MIDLHSHTLESDGTSSPEDLVREAHAAGIKVLAITDHDTLAAHSAAAAAAAGLDIQLVRGIEISCKHAGRTVHLLGYFFDGAPPSRFTDWLSDILESRRDRNRLLAARLQELGVDVQLEEAERLGRGLTGRPHFARVMIEKGYVRDFREAFDRYIGEYGDAFIEREAPAVTEAISAVHNAGGVASLAHPIRVHDAENAIIELAAAGLQAIEAFHTDHHPADMERYLGLAQKLNLAVTGNARKIVEK
jgi:3',5'-nucleoside bisphosphate phosphatase